MLSRAATSGFSCEDYDARRVVGCGGNRLSIIYGAAFYRHEGEGVKEKEWLLTSSQGATPKRLSKTSKAELDGAISILAWLPSSQLSSYYIYHTRSLLFSYSDQSGITRLSSPIYHYTKTNSSHEIEVISIEKILGTLLDLMGNMDNFETNMSLKFKH